MVAIVADAWWIRTQLEVQDARLKLEMETFQSELQQFDVPISSHKPQKSCGFTAGMQQSLSSGSPFAPKT